MPRFVRDAARPLASSRSFPLTLATSSLNRYGVDLGQWLRSMPALLGEVVLVVPSPPPPPSPGWERSSPTT